jgi:hypothetical protein
LAVHHWGQVMVMHETQIPITNTPLRIGASSLRIIESQNLCLVTYVGILDVGIIDQMNSALIATARRLRPLYMIVDLSRAGTVTQLGRRHSAGGMLALDPAATAVVGASFHMRVVVEMIVKASKFLHTGLNGPVEFFSSEKEARSWVTQLQQNVQQQVHTLQ